MKLANLFVSFNCTSVLQEESSVKPEEQGPRSRFGPSTEDLTNASKQVRTADIDVRVMIVLFY